jgi:hypothetical protein
MSLLWNSWKISFIILLLNDWIQFIVRPDWNPIQRRIWGVICKAGERGEQGGGGRGPEGLEGPGNLGKMFVPFIIGLCLS